MAVFDYQNTRTSSVAGNTRLGAFLDFQQKRTGDKRNPLSRQPPRFPPPNEVWRRSAPFNRLLRMARLFPHLRLALAAYDLYNLVSPPLAWTAGQDAFVVPNGWTLERDCSGGSIPNNALASQSACGLGTVTNTSLTNNWWTTPEQVGSRTFRAGYLKSVVPHPNNPTFWQVEKGNVYEITYPIGQPVVAPAVWPRYVSAPAVPSYAWPDISDISAVLPGLVPPLAPPSANPVARALPVRLRWAIPAARPWEREATHRGNAPITIPVGEVWGDAGRIPDNAIPHVTDTRIISATISGINMYTRPASYHTRRPPRKNEKEKKLTLRSAAPVLFHTINTIGDAADLIDVFWDVLPKSVKTPLYREYLGRVPKHVKLRAIYDNFEKIDPAAAALNFLFEEGKDFLYGILGKGTAEANKAAGRSEGLDTFGSMQGRIRRATRLTAKQIRQKKIDNARQHRNRRYEAWLKVAPHPSRRRWTPDFESHFRQLR